jgi:hypothetical protein
MRTISIIILLCLYSGLLSQVIPSKKELIIYHKIYGIAIDSFLNSKPTFLFLVNSTDNKRIRQFDFKELVDYLSRSKYSKLDSSWIDILKECEVRKHSFQSFSLDKIKSTHSIKLINRDTLFTILNDQYRPGNDLIKKYGWINGWMTVSNIFLSKNKNKAIVEISHTKSLQNGHGAILLLEKRKKGKWIVIEKWRTWVA